MRAEHGLSAPDFYVANYVAKAIAKDHPKVKVIMLAYGFDVNPPTHVKPGEPNLCVAFASGMFQRYYRTTQWTSAPRTQGQDYVQDFEGWQKIAPGGMFVWSYYAAFGNFITPYQDFDYMGPNARFYKKHGVRGMMTQLTFGALADFGDLRCWLYGQMTWNPDQDEQKLIGEWIDGTCGKGAPFVRKYYELRLKARARKGQDVTAADYLEARDLFIKAVAAAKDEPAALARVERLSAGLIAAMIRDYDLTGIAAAAKAKKIDLPTRSGLIDQLEVLGKKYATKGWDAAWSEGGWNFADYIAQLRKNVSGK